MVLVGNTLAFHPGDYVKDIVEDLNLSRTELAVKLDVELETLNNLIDGKIDLDEELAYKLEKLTGVDVKTWLNLQESYNEKVSKN